MNLLLVLVLDVIPQFLQDQTKFCCLLDVRDDYSITHPLVGVLENRFGRHVEGSLEEENAAHDGDGVGGGSLEQQVVNGFHFGGFFTIFANLKSRVKQSFASS